MNIKKILLSTLTIGVVAIVTMMATSAFFSDTETSAGNTFTAGAVDLTIDSISHTYQGGQDDLTGFEFNEEGFNFSMSDLKPLDWGTIEYNLTNEENEAYVCVMVDYESPSVLADYLNFMFDGQSGPIQAVAGNWYSLATLDTDQTFSPTVDYCFGIYDNETCVLDDVDYNPAQNSSLVADISFYAVQTRNNPDFDCSSLNSTWNEPTLSGQNQANKDLNRPHINWTINGNVLEVEFVNPTNFSFVFDYRIDDEAGTPDEWTLQQINEGELSGELFGDRYNSVNPGSHGTTTLTFNANQVDDKLEIILRRGAEQNWYLDWITFTVTE